MLGLGVYVYLNPKQSRDVWYRFNYTISSLLGTNPGEYVPPKSYFIKSATLIQSFPTDTTIMLTDYSRWVVRDVSTISNWSIGHTIQIGHAADNKFPYILDNQDTNTRVHAKFMGKG